MGAELIPFTRAVVTPEAQAARCCLQALLPDYHPQVPTAPAHFAVPYADDY